VALSLRGAAVIDTPNFYGSLGSRACSRELRLGPGRRTELFGTLSFIDFQYAQNASLKGTAARLGPLTLGASHAFSLPRDLPRA